MGEVAVVTGAAGGIGAAVARRLAAGGVRCVLVDRKPEVEQVAASIGGEAVVGDLADPELSERMVAAAGGRLDLLVLNAGINSVDKDPATLDLGRYQAVVGVNQHSVVYGLRAGLPVMRAGGGGSIVVTASHAALRGIEQDPIYTMTKHAVIGLVRALAGPLSRESIRISAVCPGLVDTPLTEPARDRFQAAGIPMLGADDVAAAIVGLLRDGAPGTELVVSPGKPPTRYFPAALD
ncbi:SDR family oxidoreductase [Frankia sp. AgB1.9]|uniref:SDR family oxidoreductase n=1 Tax=unclassified Frankia TaxID=2632575 RepID=UPI0019322D30|nr:MULTISPECIES: SDR family oxidoreductase [unclassified Frankia]MBL7487949.1 SDR family oxidoreductase [Frankia sp. AgW1.1]MBL7550392.1 SDR family oxidoreductase [Frankia sp. AgB1.9]MBL7620862.1 SDR family oxidoreductase [Frankia sp. AgB1.8]